MSSNDTEEEGIPKLVVGPPPPGLLVVWSAGAPRHTKIPLIDNALEIGRETFPFGDKSVSGRHARLSFHDGRWRVTDHGSTNGTRVDGMHVREWEGEPRLLKFGKTIALPIADLTPIEETDSLLRGDYVETMALRRLHSKVERAARTGMRLLILGESGTGKDRLARLYHDWSTRPNGPFFVRNCAELTKDLSGAQLFGSAKGAYTGAVVQKGDFAAAEGGTLFLDEVGELALEVQAKLLIAVEKGVITPLGGSPRPVDVRVVAATHRPPNSEFFRVDFYHRLAQEVVEILPLRERLAEIPWLISLVYSKLEGSYPPISAAFVEECMLRRLSGNVRDLTNLVRRAASSSIDGEKVEAEIEASHLPRDLDPPLSLAPPSMPVDSAPTSVPPDAVATLTDPADILFRDQILQAIQDAGGNVTLAARRFGKGKTWLYGQMSRLAITVKRP